MTSEIETLQEVGDFSPAQSMPFAMPQYSRTQVNAAGDTLMKLRAEGWWRTTETRAAYSRHSGPLLHMRMLLTSNSTGIDQYSLIAQRIKRLSSIEAKLLRFNTMHLTQMQDIGGCRAIVGSIRDVHALAEKLERSKTQHIFDHKDDYISRPQDTGYRGIHLIYRFSSAKAMLKCKGLKIEMQIRSPLQHAWATAVETVGMFTRQALKSSQGEAEWLRFFELMGTVIAVKEDTPRVQNTPFDNNELIDEVGEHEQLLDIIQRLHTFRQALREIEEPTAVNARYFLLEMDPNAQSITITGFRSEELFRATDRYTEAEKKVTESGGDAVLVSVDSLAALRRAYPNYFLDTKVFLDLLEGSLRDGI